MFSFDTLAGLPMPWLFGAAFMYAASIRSLRPQRIPDDWGPITPLPPLKLTMSAPARMNLVRLSAGGSIAAASTMTGTPRAWAISTTVSSGSAPDFFGPKT